MDDYSSEVNFFTLRAEFEAVYQSIKDKQLPAGERTLLEMLRSGFRLGHSISQLYVIFSELMNRTAAANSVIRNSLDSLYIKFASIGGNRPQRVLTELAISVKNALLDMEVTDLRKPRQFTLRMLEHMVCYTAVPFPDEAIRIVLEYYCQHSVFGDKLRNLYKPYNLVSKEPIDLTKCDNFHVRHLALCLQFDAKHYHKALKQSVEFYRGIKDVTKREALQDYLSAILSLESDVNVYLAMSRVLDNSSNNSKATKLFRPAFYEFLIAEEYVAYMYAAQSADSIACLQINRSRPETLIVSLATLIHGHPAIYKRLTGARDRTSHKSLNMVNPQHNIFFGNTMANMLLGVTGRAAKQGRVRLRIIYELAAVDIVPICEVLGVVSSARQAIESKFNELSMNIAIIELDKACKKLDLQQVTLHREPIFARLTEAFKQFLPPVVRNAPRKRGGSLTVKRRLSRSSTSKLRDPLSMSMVIESDERLCYALLKLKMAMQHCHDDSKLFFVLQRVLAEFGDARRVVNAPFFNALGQAYNQFALQHHLTSVDLVSSTTHARLLQVLPAGDAVENVPVAEVTSGSETTSEDDEWFNTTTGEFSNTPPPATFLK